MHVARRNARDAVMDGLQAGQELLDSEVAEGIAALKLGDVQGHVVALRRSWKPVGRCAEWAAPYKP